MAYMGETHFTPGHFAPEDYVGQPHHQVIPVHSGPVYHEDIAVYDPEHLSDERMRMDVFMPAHAPDVYASPYEAYEHYYRPPIQDIKR